MTNGGIIEGQRSFLFRCSDLSPATYLVGRIRYEASSNPRRATMQCVATQHLARKKDGQRHPTNLFCQSVPKTPMNVGEPWATMGRAANLPNGSMRVCHGAGITDEENKAGQHDDIASLPFSYQNGGDRRLAGSGDTQGLCASAELQSASHCVRNPLNLHAEKGMHARPQHFTFGSGETRMHMRATLGGIKGLSRVLRHPAPKSL